MSRRDAKLTPILIGVGMLLATVVVGLTARAVLGPQSPSEKRAAEQRENLKRVADNPFSGFAAAMIPEESIDVRVTGKPTIEIGNGSSQFGVPLNHRNPVDEKYSRLTLMVSNQSTKAVAGFTGRFQLIQPGRTIEIWGADIHQDIPSGIEPGEALGIQFLERVTGELEGFLNSEFNQIAGWKFYFTTVLTADGKTHTTSQDAVDLIRVEAPPADPFFGSAGIFQIQQFLDDKNREAPEKRQQRGKNPQQGTPDNGGNMIFNLQPSDKNSEKASAIDKKFHEAFSGHWINGQPKVKFVAAENFGSLSEDLRKGLVGPAAAIVKLEFGNGTKLPLNDFSCDVLMVPAGHNPSVKSEKVLWQSVYETKLLPEHASDELRSIEFAVGAPALPVIRNYMKHESRISIVYSDQDYPVMVELPICDFADKLIEINDEIERQLSESTTTAQQHDKNKELSEWVDKSLPNERLALRFKVSDIRPFAGRKGYFEIHLGSCESDYGELSDLRAPQYIVNKLSESKATTIDDDWSVEISGKLEIGFMSDYRSDETVLLLRTRIQSDGRHLTILLGDPKARLIEP